MRKMVQTDILIIRSTQCPQIIARSRIRIYFSRNHTANLIQYVNQYLGGMLINTHVLRERLILTMLIDIFPKH